MRPVCDRCGAEIADFNSAGRLGKLWLHKSCWLETWREERARGSDLPVLSSPLVSKPREMAVLLFALMFHFGLGLALIGWVLISQEQSPVAGTIILVIGVVTPVIGVGGMVLSVYRRRQYELVLSDLGGEGSWTALPIPEGSRE
jgi:hypothetical protein